MFARLKIHQKFPHCLKIRGAEKSSVFASRTVGSVNQTACNKGLIQSALPNFWRIVTKAQH